MMVSGSTVLFGALAVHSVSPALCALGCLQVAGLFSAWFTRIAQGTSHERTAQIFFLFALAVIGAVCGASLEMGPGTSALSASTLALMTLIAVADFQSGSEHAE